MKEAIIVGRCIAEDVRMYIVQYILSSYLLRVIN